MPIKLEVTGVDGAIAKVDKLRGYKPLISACIEKSLAEMRNRSNSITPKKTGELRNSAFKRREGDLAGVFGFSKEYAPYVEYGHRLVRGGRQVGYVSARPYLRPNAQAQSSIFASDCQKAIEQLAK